MGKLSDFFSPIIILKYFFDFCKFDFFANTAYTKKIIKMSSFFTQLEGIFQELKYATNRDFLAQLVQEI